MGYRIYRFIPVTLFVLLATILSSFLISTNSFAQETPSQAITLSPASTDVSLDAGSSISEKIDIINGGNNPFTASLTTAPYYVIGADYDPQFTQLPGTVDASQWIKLSLDKTTLQGNKSITVPFTITVPKNTPPGGYYAVIFAEASTDEKKSGVVSRNRVGNILYITVNGDIKSGGDLTGPSFPSFSFLGSLPISAKISNTGGTHFITRATYAVDDMFGRPVYKSTTERYVLPQTERVISTTWNAQPIFGVFTIQRSATVAGEIKTLPNERIIIINPWLLVVITFIIGLLIGIPVRRAMKRRHLKKSRQAKK